MRKWEVVLYYHEDNNPTGVYILVGVAEGIGIQHVFDWIKAHGWNHAVIKDVRITELV